MNFLLFVTLRIIGSVKCKNKSQICNFKWTRVCSHSILFDSYWFAIHNGGANSLLSRPFLHYFTFKDNTDVDNLPIRGVNFLSSASFSATDLG